MYKLDVKPYADDIFKKLVKKNLFQLRIIQKKLVEIRENPYHSYKFLKAPLHTFQRVHIDGSFVLIFKIHHATETVEVWYYGHHDEVYKGKFVFQE